MNLIARSLLALGALNALLVVAAGAYGAHALRDESGASVFHTAVQYHMFHALGLLAIGIVAALRPGAVLLGWAGALMLSGIVLFCGSLYVHALTGFRGFGPVTPFGGIAFMAAWLLFAVAVWRS